MSYDRTAMDRFNDLQRQGFMRSAMGRVAPKAKPIVACNACKNWHTEGKHTQTDPAIRRANLKDHRAMLKWFSALRAEAV